jgi:hypothetical protein
MTIAISPHLERDGKGVKYREPRSVRGLEHPEASEGPDQIDAIENVPQRELVTDLMTIDLEDSSDAKIDLEYVTKAKVTEPSTAIPRRENSLAID